MEVACQPGGPAQHAADVNAWYELAEKTTKICTTLEELGRIFPSCVCTYLYHQQSRHVQCMDVVCIWSNDPSELISRFCEAPKTLIKNEMITNQVSVAFSGFQADSKSQCSQLNIWKSFVQGLGNGLIKHGVCSSVGYATHGKRRKLFLARSFRMAVPRIQRALASHWAQ